MTRRRPLWLAQSRNSPLSLSHHLIFLAKTCPFLSLLLPKTLVLPLTAIYLWKSSSLKPSALATFTFAELLPFANTYCPLTLLSNFYLASSYPVWTTVTPCSQAFLLPPSNLYSAFRIMLPASPFAFINSTTSPMLFKPFTGYLWLNVFNTKSAACALSLWMILPPSTSPSSCNCTLLPDLSAPLLIHWSSESHAIGWILTVHAPFSAAVQSCGISFLCLSANLCLSTPSNRDWRPTCSVPLSPNP